MRRIDHDSIPHLIDCLIQMANRQWCSLWAKLIAWWWDISLGRNCAFFGLPRFRRHPQSQISIGAGCIFRSSPSSNLIGINRPCIISTLIEGATIEIGSNCGFSGTVISSASKIVIGENVRCGANTLITDTDWHTNDPRTGPDAPVIIERGVWLGVNVIVLKGVTIGERTLVAAGSIVTKSLPPGVIAAGLPARVIREV